MMRWFERLRRMTAVSSPLPEVEARAAEGATKATTELRAELGAAVENTRKTARAVTKLEARLESLEVDVGELLSRSRANSDEFFEPLMDALDALDGARDALSAGHHEGAAPGLDAIRSRLELLLQRGGYARHAEVGVPVDGRLHRVVGTQAVGAGPSHTVARIVRAAVTRGAVVVRGGEVIAQSSPAGESGQRREPDQDPDREETTLR